MIKRAVGGVVDLAAEGMEEMLQNVAQEASQYQMDSAINEFYGKAVNPEGANHVVDIFDAYAEGFNKTFKNRNNTSLLFREII